MYVCMHYNNYMVLICFKKKEKKNVILEILLDWFIIKWIVVVNVGVRCCVIQKNFFIMSNVYKVCKLIIRILVIAICIKYNIQDENM